MAKRYDIVALGECLIDFVQQKEGSLQFSGNPGGAPANVLAAAARLGQSTAFIGKVGQDVFGEAFQKALLAEGIDTAGLVLSPAHNTTLAFVSLNAAGDRGFNFYRDKTADVELCFEEVPLSLLQGGRIFHFGSVSLTSEPAREATLRAVASAKSHGSLISYDPNYRPALWKTPQQAQEMMRKGLSLADVVKLSEEEAFFLSGQTEPSKAARFLMDRYGGVSTLAVTCAEKGAWLFSKTAGAYAPAYKVASVDTTGAGDAFWGAFLYCVLEARLVLPAEKKQLDKIAAFCNAAGSLATTRYGAIPAMPKKEDILSCMKNTQLY